MFDVLFKDRVTVRRAKAGTRDARNAVAYEEVLDETGSPTAIKCRLERRGRRVLNTAGTETQTDATMFFRSSKAPALSLEDYVVFGTAIYRVVGIASQPAGALGVEYSRADLTLDRTDVPEDADEP